MKLQQFFIGALISFLIASCAINKPDVKNISPEKMSANLGGKLFTAAWMQRSAEYEALCLQAYNIAQDRLVFFLSQNKEASKPLAIVTDIDETLIDNTDNYVNQAFEGRDFYKESWDKWCFKGEAKALAGAVDFFNFADKQGVTIFYVSNREEKHREGTLKNLKNLGFPQVSDDKLLLKTTTSDKTTRREKVLENHTIALLIGDNLGDFDHVFDTLVETERSKATHSLSEQFGRKFIMIPNPNYGKWEEAIFEGYPSLKVKDEKLIKSLRTY